MWCEIVWNKCKISARRWWASSSDTLIYPSIFAFPSLSLHRWSTTMHLCSNATACACACMTIALAPLDRSRLFDGHMTYNSHVFTSILSVSNMPPPAVQPITSSRTVQSGTFSIASPYAHILVYHSYLTCLYLPFTREEHHWSPNQLPIWVSPRIEI